MGSSNAYFTRMQSPKRTDSLWNVIAKQQKYNPWVATKGLLEVSWIYHCPISLLSDMWPLSGLVFLFSFSARILITFLAKDLASYSHYGVLTFWMRWCFLLCWLVHLISFQFGVLSECGLQANDNRFFPAQFSGFRRGTAWALGLARWPLVHW